MENQQRADLAPNSIVNWKARPLIRFLKVLPAALLTLLLMACGSSNNNTATAVKVRLVNATQSASLTGSMNGTVQFTNQAAGSASGYVSVTPGNYTITVATSNGSLVSSTLTIGLGSGQTYTLLAYDRNGAVFTNVFTENQLAPATGYSTFSLANLSPDSGPVDLYVVPVGTPSTSLSGLTPTFTFAQSGVTQVGTALVAGSYELFATATGNPTDIRFNLPSLALANGQILTVAFTSTPGGALVNAVLLNQAGSVQFAPTTNARVRVMSALPTSGGSQVGATVGGIPLTPVFTPVPSAYTLIPGNTTAYSITVAGTAVASPPAANFATGGDFTILVYGAAASPLISIFTDNNQVPVAGQVKLRLVNGAVNVAGGVTMYVNNIQAASSIAYGTSSAYFGVSTSSISTLQLISPSAVSSLFPFSLNTAGAGYTVLVFDPNNLATLSPQVIRDR